MYRNRKQQSNYYSQPYLYDVMYMVPHPFSKISEPMYPRPKLQQREIPIIDEPNQTSSVLKNPYNKDPLLDMQQYIVSIYGKRKEKPLYPQYSQSMLRQKQRLEHLVLPRILRSHQKCVKDREKEEIKIMRNLEDRYQRLQPQIQKVYNQARLNECQQCAILNQSGESSVHHKHKNHPKNVQKQAQTKRYQKQLRIQQKPRISPIRRKRLLSRFRVIGYAVFFTVIFPDYSYLFGHYKLKQFLSKYLIENNSYIRKMNYKLQQKFKQIPLYEQIRKLHEQYQNENFSVNNNFTEARIFSKQPKMKISSQSTQQNYVINLNVFKNIIGMILRIYMQLVDDLNEDELQFLSVGMLNTSYYGDQIYSIQELAFINYHEEKGNIIVNKKQQQALIISNFVIKHIIHHHLLRLAIDPIWHEELFSFSTLKTHQIQFFKIICKQIQLSAYLLYQIAIKHFYLLINTKKQGNFCNINDSAMPLMIKTMKFPSLVINNQERDNLMKNQQIYKIIYKHNHSQRTISKFNSKYDWKTHENQILQQYTKLIQDNPFNLIHNNSQFDELSPIISQFLKSSYQKIQHSLIKIVNRLYKKINQKKRKNYRRYHEQVMKTKYILTKEHDILQGIMFLRSEEEKKIVAMNKRMLEIYIQTLEHYEFQQKDKVNTLSSNKYLSTNNDKNISKGTYAKKKIGSRVSITLEESSKHGSFDSDRNMINHNPTEMPFMLKKRLNQHKI